MTRRRQGRMLVTAAMAALGVAGCGSGSSTSVSSLDPAAAVPSTAPLYFSAAVRPGRSESATVKTIVDNFGGSRAYTKLLGTVDKLLSHEGLSSTKLDPWLGKRVGVAFTSVPTAAELRSDTPADLLLVFPTNNVAQARSVLESAVRKPGNAGSVVGVHGAYVLVGSSAAVRAAESAKSTLASTPAYHASSSTGSSTLATGYVEVKPLITGLSGGYASALKSTGAGAELAKLPADAAITFSLRATRHAITVDVVSHDVPKPAASASTGASSVAGLPGDSILALALDIKQSTVDELSTALTTGLAGLQSLVSRSGSVTGTAPQITKVVARAPKLLGLLGSILPALGPLELSFGGTGLSSLTAGLSIDSYNSAAATKLLSQVYALVAKSSSVQAAKTAGGGFTVGLPPLFSLAVTRPGGKILALLGYRSAAAFLHPSSTLATNAGFRSALSQLPSGASAPLYLNLGPLDTLLKAVGPLAGGGTLLGKAEQVLNHLGYVILGTSSRDFRLVIGLT